MKLNLEDIFIRTELKPGDIGYLIHLHGWLYKREYQYGIEFEIYTAEGLSEFFRNYIPGKDKIWLCEHNGKIIGSLVSKHRGDSAQLRYFLIVAEYRGLGLGDKLIKLFVRHIKEQKYKSAYLWTTSELDAASRLYKKYGFRLTEEKESTAFGKPVTEHRYDLALN